VFDLIAVKNGNPCCVIHIGADELAKSEIIISEAGKSGMAPD